MLVGEHAALIRAQSDVLQPQSLRVRPTTDGDQHVIGVQGLCFAARRRFDLQLHAAGRGNGSGDLRTQLELDALFAQGSLQGLAGLAIYPRADAIEVFDHGHLGTQAPPDRTQFEADDAGADHHQMSGHLTQGQGAGGVEDTLVIDGHAWQGRGFRAGGDDDVLGAEFGLGAIVACNGHLARPVDVAPAFDPVDLVLAKQKLDALGQAGHAFVLLLHHLRKVEGGADFNAQVGEFRSRGGFVQFRGMQQGLGGHAADVQAGAAQGGSAFDTGGFQAQLPGPNRRVIPAGSAAQNDHVVVAHRCSPAWPDEKLWS
ncbi:hypothetical protein PFLU4_58270 [Pseudomonas fluorescens]|nr:hypothetical protein PFLU4_58270 [Pseudomonas fluorescens]